MNEGDAYGEVIVGLLRHPPALVAPYLLLLLGERSGHGYELSDRLCEFGFPSPGNGVYRELRRMEEAGLLRSVWAAGPTRGPARRVYELTGAGRDALDDCVDGANDLMRVLRGYQRRARATIRRRSAF